MTSYSNEAEKQHAEQLAAIRLRPMSTSEPVTFKEFDINNAPGRNLCICSPSEVALFSVINSSYTRGVPDVTIHAGADKSGPTLGVAHLGVSGKHTVGLGDPNGNISSVVWEGLSRTSRKWSHRTYQFESLFGDKGRKVFVWKQAVPKPFDDQGNMELFEDGKEDIVLAKYIGVGLFKRKKRGQMLIIDGYGETWELIVLLTGLSLVELARRRARLVQQRF